jgi:hypothetical protein
MKKREKKNTSKKHSTDQRVYFDRLPSCCTFIVSYINKNITAGVDYSGTQR